MGKLNMRLMQGIEETENQIKTEKQNKMSQSIPERTDASKSPKTSQKPQTAPKQSKKRRNTKKSKETENKPNTSSQKQVFSFRAIVSDISIWRAYATASGQTMEYIGNAAMNEYLRRHKLNDAQRAVFEALKAVKERE